jgi:hypothetical protein
MGEAIFIRAKKLKRTSSVSESASEQGNRFEREIQSFPENA